eukprot:Gb_29514 [translate_table: standard]
MNTLDYFKVHLKYEKNHKIKEAISHFIEYLRRAEEIRDMLDNKGNASMRQTQVKTKEQRREQKRWRGSIQTKLCAALNSTIILENLSVSWSDVAWFENAKQGL